MFLHQKVLQVSEHETKEQIGLQEWQNVNSRCLGFVVGICCYYKKIQFRKMQIFPLLKSVKLKEQLFYLTTTSIPVMKGRDLWNILFSLELDLSCSEVSVYINRYPLVSRIVFLTMNCVSLRIYMHDGSLCLQFIVEKGWHA